MMRNFFFVVLTAVLTACTTGDDYISAGTHNLSKGDCESIRVCSEDGVCRVYHEMMTQIQCEMVGGEFSTRDYSKGWFF